MENKHYEDELAAELSAIIYSYIPHEQFDTLFKSKHATFSYDLYGAIRNSMQEIIHFYDIKKKDDTNN